MASKVRHMAQLLLRTDLVGSTHPAHTDGGGFWNYFSSGIPSRVLEEDSRKLSTGRPQSVNETPMPRHVSFASEHAQAWFHNSMQGPCM